MDRYRRVEADIDLSAIRKNIEAVQAVNDSSMRTLLVIKADAYGHGSVMLAREFDDLADYYGVACIDEAMELRNAGIEKPILILGYTDEYYFREAIENDVTLAVYDVEKCRILSDTAVSMGRKARVHIKADSGMSRIGFQCDAEGVAAATEVLGMEGLNIEGVFTHFAKADEFDKTAAIDQYEKFIFFTDALEEAGAHFEYKHID
ncbi:MAG: alanine racemase, partial [Eubacterium sp.]|nr:alanine racemase [Eubacterium sp.]